MFCFLLFLVSISTLFKLLRAFADAFFDRVCRAEFALQLMRNSLSLFLSLWRLCFELDVVVVVADLLATNIAHA